MYVLEEGERGVMSVDKEGWEEGRWIWRRIKDWRSWVQGMRNEGRVCHMGVVLWATRLKYYIYTLATK